MTLSADSCCMLYVPVGFAHGFCVVGEEAVVSYKVTEEYAPDLERGIAWNDRDIGIHWPVTTPIISARDAQLPLLRDADNSFEAG
jgi:dTDP-4-dehydrorhamnose 3,5-epimerase